MDNFDKSIIAAIPRLTRYARSISNEPQDLVQATCLRALEKRHLYRDLGQPIDGWLIRMASNIRYDWKNKKTVDLVSDDTDNGISKEIAGDTAVLVIEVLKEIEKLPDDAREVLLMYADGIDQSEASIVLGVPTGTVASRLNRAQNKMREKFS